MVRLNQVLIPKKHRTSIKRWAANKARTEAMGELGGLFKRGPDNPTAIGNTDEVVSQIA